MRPAPTLDSVLELADDAFLVTRSRDGDMRAFAMLLTRHERTLRRYIARLTRHAADADDVLQETAIKAWQHLDAIDDPARVRAWMMQVATREALRTIGSRRQEHELAADDAVVPGPDRDALRLDIRAALQEVLDDLPRRQAQCWAMRELGGFSYREIAEQLDVPESTVRGSLAAARRRILTAMWDHR